MQALEADDPAGRAVADDDGRPDDGAGKAAVQDQLLGRARAVKVVVGSGRALVRVVGAPGQLPPRDEGGADVVEYGAGPLRQCEDLLGPSDVELVRGLRP